MSSDLHQVPELTLPPTEANFLEAAYAKADVILEYGSGGSTLLAARQKHSLVASVESDQSWAENLQAVLARDFPKANVKVHWENIGPTKEWGYPVDASQWRRYHRYPLAVWRQPWFAEPDLVLVDGRFRMACFLATFLNILRPTTLLFDDYGDRPYYAKVERFAKPVEMVGRMARFELQPQPIRRKVMADVMHWFADER